MCCRLIYNHRSLQVNGHTKNTKTACDDLSILSCGMHFQYLSHLFNIESTSPSIWAKGTASAALRDYESFCCICDTVKHTSSEEDLFFFSGDL